jgi:hypothetical protein
LAVWATRGRSDSGKLASAARLPSETPLPIKWFAGNGSVTAEATKPSSAVTDPSRLRAKKSCFRRFLVGSSPYMTAIADSKHRVTLRQARSGDRFGVEILAEGKYVLTRLEPAKPQPSRVRFEKRNGYTVGISDQPVSEQAIRDALDEFP